MNTYLIALPPEWESRICKILEHRGHFPIVLPHYDGQTEFLRNGDPAIVLFYADNFEADSLRHCGRLRERRSRAELKILVCTPAPPDKQQWPAFLHAGVDFVLSSAFSDYELGFRMAASECLLKSASAADSVAQGPGAETEFVPDNEHVSYGEFRTTLTGKFIKVNHGLVRLLGYSSKEELLRADVVRDIYFDPEERTRLVATIPSQRISVESDWKRRDGSPIAIHLSGHVVLDESQGTIYFQGIAWDISEQKHSRELLLMQRDLGIALSRISSLREVLDIVLDFVTRIEGVDCGGLYLVEEETRTYRMASSRGLSPGGASVAAVATPDYSQVQLCEKGKPFYMQKAEFPPYLDEWCRSEGIISLGCIPIVHNGRPIASLNLASRTKEEFSRMARLALETVAMQVGGGIARVQAEETLRASRANLQTLFDAMDDMVFVADSQGKIIHHNLAVEKRLGYNREEMLQMTIPDLHPPDRLRDVAVNFSQISLGPQVVGNIPFRTKSGEPIPVEIRVMPGEWAGQKVSFGVARDLSEREASRKAIEQSEARFRAIFENASVGIGLSDISGWMLDVNEAVAKMEGLAREEIIGRHYLEFTTPEDGAAQSKLMRDVAEGRIRSYELEKRYFHKDGTTFWVRNSSSIVPVAPGEKPQYLISVIENIDARKRAEQSLRESENRYRLITDNVEDIVWSARWTPPDTMESFDPQSLLEAAIEGWRFEYVSPSVERLFGFTVEECLSDMPEYRKVPESFPAIAQNVLNDLAAHDDGESFRRSYEIPLFTKDGSQRWCEVTATFLPTEADEPYRLIGILRDITSRREIREALRKSEAQLRGLFENLPDLVLLLDQNATIRYVNHGTPTVAAEVMLGENGFGFLEESSQQQAREAFAKALSSKEARTVEGISIFGTHWFFRIVPMVMEGILDQVMIICTDVTAEKKSALEIVREQQLLRQLIDLQERERRFLSYEIHDGFAQQITGALFHLEAFQRLREEDRSQAEKNLDQAASLLSRSIDETRRLISGLRPPILDESGILAAIEYLICEYRERSGVDIMFRHDLRGTRLAPPLESAVFRIVQESLTNATRHSRSDFIRVELHELEDRLQIVVFDEGVGFDPAQVPDNRFGLRSIRERTRLLDGQVEIDTAPGEGCSIRVELPLVPAAE